MMKEQGPEWAAGLGVDLPAHSARRVMFDDARDFLEGWAKLTDKPGKGLDGTGDRMERG